MKFRILSTLAAAAMSLSFSFGAHAQVALPSLGSLPIPGGVPALPGVPSVPGVPAIPGLPALSLGTLTNLLGGSGVPSLPGLPSGTPSLPGLPGGTSGTPTINGLPVLPGTSDSADLNGYLARLGRDLNGIPVPTRLNALFSNSPIPPPASVPAFPAFPGAQELANMNLPVLSGLVQQLIVLNRTQVSAPTGGIPSLPALPTP